MEGLDRCLRQHEEKARCLGVGEEEGRRWTSASQVTEFVFA